MRYELIMLGQTLPSSCDTVEGLTNLTPPGYFSFILKKSLKKKLLVDYYCKLAGQNGEIQASSRFVLAIWLYKPDGLTVVQWQN